MAGESGVSSGGTKPQDSFLAMAALLADPTALQAEYNKLKQEREDAVQAAVDAQAVLDTARKQAAELIAKAQQDAKAALADAKTQASVILGEASQKQSAAATAMAAVTAGQQELANGNRLLEARNAAAASKEVDLGVREDALAEDLSALEGRKDAFNKLLISHISANRAI